MDEIESAEFMKRLLEENFGAQVINNVAKKSVADERIELKGQIKILEFIYQDPLKKYIYYENKPCQRMRCKDKMMMD